MTKNHQTPLSLKSVQIMLTNRCNLRCPICSIWQEKKKTTLGLKTLKEILSLLIKKTGRLECLFVTGGEPLLEYKRVLELLSVVVPLVAAGKIREMNINTNGTLLEPLQKIARALPAAYRKHFSFSITLHGWKDAYSPSAGKTDLFPKVVGSLKFLKKQGYDVEINFVVSPWTAPYIYKAYRLAKELHCTIDYSFYTPQMRSFFHYKQNKPIIDENNFPKDWTRTYAGQWDQILQDGAIGCRQEQIELLQMYMTGKGLPKDIFQKCLRFTSILFIRCTGEIYSCFQDSPVSLLKHFHEKDWKGFMDAKTTLIRSIRSKGCPECMIGALQSGHETFS